MSVKRISGHKLTTYTSTIKNTGAHITVGTCDCGWHTEATYVREAREAYRSHLNRDGKKPDTLIPLSERRKNMKNTFLAISLALISTAGCAQLTPGDVIGGVAGGLIGSQIGGGTGRVVATAAGAVIGANMGRNVYGYGYPAAAYPVQAPVVTARGYPPGVYPVYQYGSYYDGTNPIYERNLPCEHETHLDGVYNPPAAQAYCRGRIEREYRLQKQYERDAYSRGIQGQPADRGYLR